MLSKFFSRFRKQEDKLADPETSERIRLKLALEAADLVDWDFNYERNSAYRSLKHDQLYGYKEMLPTWNFDNFYHHVLPEFHALAAEKFANIPLTGEIAFDYKIRRVDGEIRWISLKGIGERNSKGKVVRVAGVLKDITEEKAIEERGRLQRQNIESLFTQSTEFFCVLNKNLEYEYVNPSHVRLFAGRNLTGLSVGVAQPELNHSEFVITLRRILETGETVKYDQVPIQIGENHLYLDMMYTPRRNSEGKVDGIYCLGSDVTDYVHSVQMRDSFISIASHELKTPLTSMKLQSQLLQRLLKDDVVSPVQLESYLAKILRQVDRLDRLVNDMLESSRSSGEKLQIHFSPVNFSKLVQDIFEQYTTQLKQSRNTLELEVEPDLYVNVDETRIEQAIVNLISNVIRYAPGGPVKVRLSRLQQKVILSVKDQGPGIAPENFETIFQRFGRVEISPDVTGFGLGLYISRIIAMAHRGTLTVQSKRGEGAEFILTLPLRH